VEQFVQIVDVVVLEKVATGQGWQTFAELSCENFPAAQGWHSWSTV